MTPDRVAAPPDPIAADPTLVAAARALLGDRIELTATLGTGRTGAVLLGSDLVALRAVAVRVLAPALAADEGRRARWRDAIALQRELAGPGIVPILDERESAAGELPACAAAVMPLVAGASLAALRPPGAAWPIDWARWLVLRAADALARLHAEGIGHGDVRASAFLVDARGDVVLTDVGVTRAVLDAATPDDAAMIRDDHRALGRLAIALVAGADGAAGDDVRTLAAALGTARGDCPADWAEAIARLVHDDDATLAGVRETLRGTLARDGGAVREALAAYARADHRERTADAVRTQAAARAAAVREVAGVSSPVPPADAAPDEEASAPRFRLMNDGDGRPLMVPVADEAATPLRGARTLRLPPRRTLAAAAALTVVALGAWGLAGREGDDTGEAEVVASAEAVERGAALATPSAATDSLAFETPTPTPTPSPSPSTSPSSVPSSVPITPSPAAPRAEGTRATTATPVPTPVPTRAVVAALEALRADSAGARVRATSSTAARPGAAPVRGAASTSAPKPPAPPRRTTALAATPTTVTRGSSTVGATPVTTKRGATALAAKPAATRGRTTVAAAPATTKRGATALAAKPTASKRGTTALAAQPTASKRGTTAAATTRTTAKPATTTRGASALARKPVRPAPAPTRDRRTTVATRTTPPDRPAREIAARPVAPAPRARDDAPRTPPPASRPASAAPAAANAAVATPSGAELREEAQRAAATARLASRYPDFFADGDDHAVTVARTPTVIGGSAGRVRADFDVRLAKYDAAGRRIVRTATVTMEVARDGAGTRATSVAYGPLRRP